MQSFQLASRDIGAQVHFVGVGHREQWLARGYVFSRLGIRLEHDAVAWCHDAALVQTVGQDLDLCLGGLAL